MTALPEFGDDPFAAFLEWFDAAKLTEPSDPNAFTLATAAANGRPGARIVLLKGMDEPGTLDRGFVFFTNMQSRKGEDLRENPQAAMLFHWKSKNRQVRIEGQVRPATGAEADDYFASRLRVSRLGAWASQQSRRLIARPVLEAKLAEMEAKYPDNDIPRPPDWGGYRIVPTQFEFWQDMPFRLHDRTVYTRDTKEWSRGKLYP
ncbi:MAG: pyridoxamine 5'-phosphate oxidase [Acetobacteraceae bacterium]|nr:pyridoxamine 5'-phosphate oxidase [Acetobacteraceae bacterium]